MSEFGWWGGMIGSTALIKVKRVTLNSEEIVGVFVEIHNKTIQLNGTKNTTSVYHKIDRDPETNRVLYFHYYLFEDACMYKVGSGGYIPLLHLKKGEVIYEFEVKEFEPNKKLIEE
jgi:hypothetical protein